MLEKKIIGAKRELVKYAWLIENMIKDSIVGLIKKDKNILEKILTEHEPESDRRELILDKLCLTLIVKYSPMAKDLRTILMIMKINSDLERIGDLASKICKNALFLIERPQVKPLIDIPRMGEIAVSMLNDSINSFIKENSDVAKDVLDRDDTVDALRDQILRELITFMGGDPKTIERSLRLLSISNSLERTADLATNIAEDVIFIVEGKVAKHQPK